MKAVLKLAAVAALVISSAAGVSAQEFTKGTVTNVDEKAKKVTLIHEELKSLHIPALTIVFSVADAAMLAKMKKGTNVAFIDDRDNGPPTVIQLKCRRHPVRLKNWTR